MATEVRQLNPRAISVSNTINYNLLQAVRSWTLKNNKSSYRKILVIT